MNYFKAVNSSRGFTGVRVFNERPATIFNGTSPTDSFLYMVLTDPKSKLLKPSLYVEVI